MVSNMCSKYPLLGAFGQIRTSGTCVLTGYFRKLACALLVTVLTCFSGVFAQSTVPEATNDSSQHDNVALRLNQISLVLQGKIKQRNELSELLTKGGAGEYPDVQETLTAVDHEIIKLQTTFEREVLGDLDTALAKDNSQQIVDWRQELVDIVEPLLDSMRALTEKPRRTAELKESIQRNADNLNIAKQALDAIEPVLQKTLDPGTANVLNGLRNKWRSAQEAYEQELLLVQSQLDRLTKDKQSFLKSVWPSTRSFLVGRGLTLLIAIAVGVAAWASMRFIWWVYTEHFTTKTQRRNHTWYRLLSYSYYIVTTIVVALLVVSVFYAREDVLLLALAFVTIAGAALSLRQVLPRYLKEVRMLLNLGPVREDECVIYRGLPWLVESLNLQAVLRNPALDGVLRLPLRYMSDMTSRPVIKDALWFPSNSGDYVLLPDGKFAQVKRQTPDLIEVIVRGSMSMTYCAAEYYAMNITNLSREQTFCVSESFGFDYELQEISLTEVPATLHDALLCALKEAGYDEHLKDLLVDFKSAGTSSLDYLIFITLQRELLPNYFKLHRLVQKTCVAVANEKGWTIPFQQLMLHQPKTNVVQ